MIICKCSALPSKKYYRDTQFSEIKRRDGKESVPFLGLDEGIHEVKFQTSGKGIVAKVKVWLSMYGWAWIIIELSKENNP